MKKPSNPSHETGIVNFYSLARFFPFALIKKREERRTK
jgi:hypothetical protein